MMCAAVTSARRGFRFTSWTILIPDSWLLFCYVMNDFPQLQVCWAFGFLKTKPRSMSDSW